MAPDPSSWSAKHRGVAILGALLTTFAGADLLLTGAKGSELQWIGLPLLAGGAALLAWTVWPRLTGAVAQRPSLAQRLVHLLSLRGRLVPFFPVFGVAIVTADLAYNAILSATPELLLEDTIVLLGAATLIAYGFVPARFSRERDFVLVFLVVLNLLLVIPLLVARAYYDDFERSVDGYAWIALAPQTSAVLSAIGVSNAVHPVAGSTAPGLTFVPVNLGIPVTVVITAACSGIYSFGIFASAFVAFVLTEYSRPTRRVWALLGLGFLASYVANILRMVVIVLVGYYTDTAQTDLQNMLLAHSYAGWIIFLGWLALFWFVLLRILPADGTGKEEVPRPEPRKGGCGICHRGMSPAIPATRCSCGAYHHLECLGPHARCPACGRALPSEAGSPAAG